MQRVMKILLEFKEATAWGTGLDSFQHAE